MNRIIIFSCVLCQGRCQDHKRLAQQRPGAHGDFARQDEDEDSNNSTDD